MGRNKKTLQFLSQPVILEESGIPMLNSLIIVTVFLIITSFIVWSVMMEINEVTTVQGVILAEEGIPTLHTHISPTEIGNIKTGHPVRVRTSRYDVVPGIITDIDLTAENYGQGMSYYEVRAKLDLGDEAFANSALAGMTVGAEIITGKRSLFQFLVQPVLATREGAFRE